MKLSLISLLVIMLLNLNAKSQDGPSVFKKNCAVCHSIGNGKLVGPDLKGVDKKHDIKWLTKWVKSSQSLVKKNDPKALQLFNDNNKMVMPDQTVSDDEIKSVIAFISEETTKLETPAIATAAPVIVPVQNSGSTQSNSTSSSGVSATTVIYILVGINIFLILVIFGLGKAIKDIAHYNNRNEI
jgi:cytochrome c2